MNSKNCIISFVVFCVILLTLLRLSYQYDSIMVSAKDLPSMEKIVDAKINVASTYLERRINRVAQTQDEYQYSTSRRIDILEERLKNTTQGNTNKNNNMNINNIRIKE